MLTGLTFTAKAQHVSKNALGLRLGDDDGFAAEISYQRKLSAKNRLEVDLGWRDQDNYYHDHDDVNAIKLTGLYQWVWNIDGGFNWYAGVGGGIGTWNHDHPNGNSDDGFFAFVAGDIGIEYDFDIPLMLSLDFRPEFGGDNYYNDHYNSDIALGIRFQF